MSNSAAEKEEEKLRAAPESTKTRKAREKLRKQLEVLEKKITPQALEKKTVEIHRWIARHAHHRVVLRTKTISLFDENQNTAKISQRIQSLAESLGQQLDSLEPAPARSLKSKISKVQEKIEETSS